MNWGLTVAWGWGNSYDPEKRSDALFKVFFEFAAALKLFAEMSSNINSISTIGVLDTESIKKELERAFPKKIKP